MAKLNFRRNADAHDLVTGPRPAANTNDDLFTLDLSGFKEGYGFSTSISTDSTGGYRGEFYLDGNSRYGFTSIERFNITGTNYADSIITGNGNDVIRAGGGNDIVQAGTGRDTLDGGAGIDGFNKSFAGVTGGVSVNLSTDTITASQGTVKGFEYFYNVVGTTGADTFVSSQARGNDSVNGGEGNDRAEFRVGDDDFTGGGGNDTLKVDHSWWTGAEGIQISFSADSAGGWRGYYYVTGSQRVDFSSTENFEVAGTKNNDAIYAGSGNDILSGNGGNDDIRSGSGNDTLDGGDGVDGLGRDLTNLSAAISINLQTSTITAAYGTIAGFEYFSSIIGSSAADTFVSTVAQADDTVTGGSGNDVATFYEGSDVFSGGLNTDRLIVDYSAQNTNKGIEMSFNVDTNGGYRGYYYVDGNTRVDFNTVELFTITGTAFGDRITTGNGADTVSAGAGNDIVTSGLGLDTLDGGAGVDGLARDFTGATAAVSINLRTSTITADYGTIAGFEYLSDVTGTNFADTFVTTLAQQNDAVNGGGNDDAGTFFEGYDVFNGGAGDDKLIVDYSGQNTAQGIQMSFDVDTNGGYRGYYYVDGDTRTNFTSVEQFTITGTDYDDTIYTGDGDDTVSAGTGWDFVSTGAGTDTLDGGTGTDGVARNFTNATFDIKVDLNANTATAAIGTIRNFEYLGSGDRGIVFVTGSGNDTLVSTAVQANDSVNTGDGDDVFTTYNGYDRYAGGTGTDRLVIDWSARDVFAGINSLTQNADTTGGYAGEFYVGGGLRVSFSSVEAFTVTGTKYGDILGGKDGNDVLNGGDGDDRIYAGSGNDKVDGGAGIDGLQKDMTEVTKAITVDVDAGKLSLVGSSFTGIEYLLDLRTGSGNDKVTTGDSLYNDVVWGNDGNDTASFFGGSDTFNGGSGTRDTLVIDYSAVDTENGVSTSMNIDNDNGGFRGYFYANGGVQTSFTGTELFNITGTKNDDTLTGADGADTLNGSDGRDTLNGGGGIDKLFGGDAADTLNGGDGNDQLTGGAAGDTMTGGAGADSFLFGPGDANGANGSLAYLDRITDFETGVDKINLSRIDADTGTAGNQAFTVVTGAFTAAGQVHVINIGGVTYLQGNVDANLTADFSIRVEGSAPLATDLVL